MYSFFFQPEISSLSNFSLHSNSSAYQGLLLKPERELLCPPLPRPRFIRENVKIVDLCLLDLVDGCQQLGKRWNFSPKFQRYYLHFVKVSYDGMDRAHMSFPGLSVLQALAFSKEVTFSASSITLLPSTFFLWHCSHSNICYNLFIMASFFCLHLPTRLKTLQGQGYLSLFTSESPVLRMASLKKYLLNE